MPVFQHWCRLLASEQHVISHTSCVFCLRAHYMCRTKAIFTGLTSNFDSILRTLCFIVRHCIILWNDVFKPVHTTTANILPARIFHIASIKTCYKCGIHVFLSLFHSFFHFFPPSLSAFLSKETATGTVLFSCVFFLFFVKMLSVCLRYAREYYCLFYCYIWIWL